MTLTDRQKKHLRRLGHQLKPVVYIGQGGSTPNMLKELEQALEHHELVKVKVRVGERDARAAAIAELVATTGAELVQRIGSVALLYRPATEQPKLVLPRR